MSFAALGLSKPLLNAVQTQHYQTPTPIQSQAIPVVLAGKDLMAAAQTGTGKTAGFTLPLLERLSKGKPARAPQVRSLILTPTRELAAQVGENVTAYSQYLPLRSAVVFGGVSINPQMMKLRKGVDILVATPGRLLDLYGQNAIRFDHLEILVLDEADRMLDMGFIHDIRKILNLLPAKRQNLMFSATFSDNIRELAKKIVHNPVEISVTPRNAAAQTVQQWICPVDKKQKSAALLHLINEQQWQQVLVFARTKHGADRLSKYLNHAGVQAAAIHGNKSQGARTKALAGFKKGDVRILVATDIAARGLDIEQLPQVVNFDLPQVAEDYVHRIGRTGRAQATGQAISLVSADEVEQLQAIEKLTNGILSRQVIDGYEPLHDVPVTRLGTRLKNPIKKPSTYKQASKNPSKNTGNRSRPGKPTAKANPSQKRKPKTAARTANSTTAAKAPAAKPANALAKPSPSRHKQAAGAQKRRRANHNLSAPR